MHINLFSLCLLICSLPILNGIWEMTRCRRSFSEIIKDKKMTAANSILQISQEDTMIQSNGDTEINSSGYSVVNGGANVMING